MSELAVRELEHRSRIIMWLAALGEENAALGNAVNVTNGKHQVLCLLSILAVTDNGL